MSDDRKVLEVEGGFIAKAYDAAGSVVAQSAVVATAEEAQVAELVALEKKDAGAGQATPEAMKDQEVKAAETAAAPADTLPSDKAGAEEGAAPAAQEGATAPAPEAGSDPVAPAPKEGEEGYVPPAAPQGTGDATATAAAPETAAPAA